MRCACALRGNLGLCADFARGEPLRPAEAAGFSLTDLTGGVTPANITAASDGRSIS